MPHASIKLRPGVDQNETPALNETGISQSQLIRFIPDKNGVGLVQKLGGWAKFYPEQITRIVRALWAWEDTQAASHLAFGTQNDSNYVTELGVITNGTLIDITPTSVTDNSAPSVTTTAGNPLVVLTNTDVEGITNYDSVYIATHISVGGIILFGSYACDQDGYISSDSFTIYSVDILGNPNPPTSSTTGGDLAQFTSTTGSSIVTVALANHGYSVGSTYPCLVPTALGNLTIYGNYIVQSVSNDGNSFTIQGNAVAVAGTSVYINGNLGRFIFSFGVGAVPAGTGYGVGEYGAGGYGTGSSVNPITGNPISATDWTLDNWGEILIACPQTPQPILNVTAVSGTGSTATVTFSQSYPVSVGSQIVVSGITPITYNGSYVVTASSTNSVSFASSATGSLAAMGGQIAVFNTPFQPIYQWNGSGSSPTATIIPQAPPVNTGVFVAMPQRQIIAYGSTQTGILDPLLISWCDVNNFNSWIPTVINQAGSYRIPKGSRIVGGIQGPQQTLIWTDISCWSMQYIGPPYVYSFNEIGTGCGLIAQKAAASINGVVYWMGPSQFFNLTSNGVQPVFCPIWDVIFQDLDQTNLQKIRVAVNSRFGEITWYYPTITDGGEINAYAKLNVVLQEWDFGTLARSAWVDQSVVGAPIGFDPGALYLYQHEEQNGNYLFNADNSPMVSSFRSGYFTLSDADVKTFIDQVWPDMKWGLYGGDQNATVNLTFYVTDYPGQTPTAYGPYPLTVNTEWISPRIRGRLVSIQLESQDLNSFWRIGNMRYRFQQDGKY